MTFPLQSVPLQSIATACAALLAVLALIWVASRAARLGGIAARRNPTGLLKVQETVALDPRRRLHLLGCDGRRVLLLTGGGQDIVVGWLPERAASEPAQPERTGP